MTIYSQLCIEKKLSLNEGPCIPQIKCLMDALPTELTGHEII